MVVITVGQVAYGPTNRAEAAKRLTEMGLTEYQQQNTPEWRKSPYAHHAQVRIETYRRSHDPKPLDELPNFV